MAQRLAELLARMEELLDRVEELEEPARTVVFELLDGVDVLHRTPIARLAEMLGPDGLAAVRADPAVAWLLDAYGAGELAGGDGGSTRPPADRRPVRVELRARR